MNFIVIVGIVVAAIIAAVAIFASTPTDTWQDKRTDLAGVAPPDENKKRIDCLSKGGTWKSTSCSLPKIVEKTESEVLGSCTGSAKCIVEKVTRIVDGDTIDTESYRIRLSLVNTPEKNQPGYYEATAFTSMTCPVGSMIRVDQDDSQLYDEYDRLLGKVFCGNQILNESLLRNGHADILPQYCFRSEFTGESWAQEYGCVKPNLDDIQNNCDPSYPDFCIAPGHADLDCGEISERNFRVLQPDPHRFDADKDGIGCES